ncbi:coniferyl aldehyde dehydrogenase [Endozoicomonas numazuensis]|uniref:coniferyl aldehyde dehydrogenase n=1 Tax=Endozoicomonas numazuensis TaxID=1137799 RepID=UPI0009DCD7B9|nr:coniferyl aldehyde dehydrogenase [Endozoicomonas numazuensis]
MRGASVLTLKTNLLDPDRVKEASETPGGEVKRLLELQRADFIREGEVSAETRIERLNQTIDLIHDNHDHIVQALAQDFGSRSGHQSIFSDVYFCLESLKHSRKHVRQWMKAEKRKLDLIYRITGSKAEVQYQPKGVVGILGTWNFPVNTVICPLAGVLAAGNRAILKFSEVSPATSALMESLVKTHFDEKVVAAVSGGPELGSEMTSAPFNHLVFTGSTNIGKKIMRSASDHLTPVTLELGGKSPVVVDREYDVQEAAEKIMIGKALNAGQVCLSPDYVFVHEDKLESFIEAATQWTRKMFPTMKNNKDYTAVVNERHYYRVKGCIDEAKERGTDVRTINPAKEALEPKDSVYKLPMTFIVNPDDDLGIMREEIFGPVLAIKSYRQISECLDFINARPHPLGLYIFSDQPSFQNKVIKQTQSGGVTLNDVIMHGGCENLPFGGVGDSGVGHYHGVYGFKEFSHARAIFKQGKINIQKLSGLIPPYTKKCDRALKAMVKK